MCEWLLAWDEGAAIKEKKKEKKSKHGPANRGSGGPLVI
jgi:hypothetical protein